MPTLTARHPANGLTAIVPGEFVYFIGSDSQVRESLFIDLTLAGISVRGFQCADEFLSSPRRDTAACVICDLRLSGMDALDLPGHLLGTDGPPTILIGAQHDARTGIRAIKAGAIDFLIYPIKPDTLLTAVNDALARDRLARQRRTETLGLRERYQRLTPREREVFALVVQGMLNKQVAGTLAISHVTVQIHRGNVMRKMKAGSFAELVCMAIRLHILGRHLAEWVPTCAEAGIQAGVW
jgi:FixJ family two-component response regulator